MSTVAAVQRANPYIGPRSFRRDEALYGRDREVQELLDLIIAERIVLLYSPSGAGKTSLVQAALVPALERESFTVHPIMRVSRRFEQELPPGTHCNRYVLSALSDLEEALPKEQQRSPAQLAAMSFERYLEQALPALVASPNGSGGASEVFIFDQFEEILTVDPADLDAKREFFAQVGHALRDRGRWALFSMREDYIAGLDPYLRAIPTRLATTYRLDLLGAAAARQAIQRPVQNLHAEIEFTDSAATQLVDNLRRIRVQRPDGSFEEQLGPYVEPVQLQVVCCNLWQKLPPGTTQITGANVTEVGDVDTALADYYAESVRLVAGSDKSERAIREWFEHQLITEQGIRGQVLQGQNSSEGLDNAVVYALVDAHLVRAEKRHGATWFELAHDRLIEPVQDDNSRWLEAHLSKVQKLAAVWEAQGRPDGLQLLGKDLIEAKQWAAANESLLTGTERKFLEASESKQEAIWREQRQTKRLRAALGIAMVLALAASFMTWAAVRSQQSAQKSAKIAKDELAEVVKQKKIADQETIEARASERKATESQKAEIEKANEAKAAEQKAIEKAHEATFAENETFRAKLQAQVPWLLYHANSSSMELFYVSNRHILELWGWVKKFDGWHPNDITNANGPKPLAAVGSPLAGFSDDVARTDAVFYVGTDQHIHEMLFIPKPTVWTGIDVTAKSGAPNIGRGSVFTAHINPITKSEEVFFVNSDGTIQELTTPSSATPTWKTSNLFSGAAGRPILANPTQPLLATFDSLTNPRIDELYYFGADGSVHELWSTTPGRWTAKKP